MLQNNTFDLQIIPGSIPPVLHMAQYDSGRQYTATLKNGSANYSVASGATAKIKGFNAAGVAWEQEATISGSTVVFAPSGAATDQFGVMPVTIEITVSDEVITPLLVVFDIQRAGYTNEEAVHSPEFETAIEAAVAAAIEEGGLGFSDDFKQALLACFAHVAWTDEHGQDYYDALEAALYPDVTLLSITADYQQDHPIYDTDDLDAIKVSDDLTVTANYSDGTSVVLADDDYELSGSLTAGTSTITVTYEGKTDSVSVVVTSTLIISDILTLDGIKNTRNGHDAAATTWEDLSGNNRDFAKYRTNAIWNSNCAVFNGSSTGYSYSGVIYPNTLTQFTIELSVKVGAIGTSSNGYPVFRCDTNTWANRDCIMAVMQNSVKTIQIAWGIGTSVSVGDNIAHIAFVFKDGKISKYLNGVLIATTSSSYSTSAFGRSTHYIGTDWSTGYFTGEIYRIGVCSTALTSDEVSSRYAAFRSRFG